MLGQMLDACQCSSLHLGLVVTNTGLDFLAELFEVSEASQLDVGQCCNLGRMFSAGNRVELVSGRFEMDNHSRISFSLALEPMFQNRIRAQRHKASLRCQP